MDAPGSAGVGDGVRTRLRLTRSSERSQGAGSELMVWVLREVSPREGRIARQAARCGG